ncbi:hypothetical protein RM844_30830 [Streptomyces sp. DSM 44915]|uniref:Uncharacterized protein n=1 Tax=Streptomyces chisholmiae TaxID=3075540 RepID=A0ABU2K092_9ACTN|nr:hypothetical protein [Streptomyces sp. DSM 44915]MDT0270676.1 hypothetical protein [Streptomyces sp. DSM 44915]
MNHTTGPDQGWELDLPHPGRAAGDWVLGACWFYCGHQIAPVTWIGALSTDGAHAPLYACGACLAQLHAMTWDYTHATGFAEHLYPHQTTTAAAGYRPRTLIGHRWTP